MKKILLTNLSLLAGMSAFAQLPVSTSAEMKNVVLEEFTGIYCGYCPQGHAVANGIYDSNSDDVIVINVHAGGYANPQGNDPDFRTPFGSAIADQSNLAGYPAGTVNRQVFAGKEMNAGGTAMSRGDWAAAADIVLAEPSYVNVALEGTLDVNTRLLTVDVETYFSGTAPSSVNLNVALLQSHIAGTQSGASGNPDQVLEDGQYEHNHMLRHLLTGQWGEVITTTTQGSTATHQFTYTIPADLNGIDYELGNLEIVAFVAEGQQNIMTGAQGPIEFQGLIADNGSIDKVDSREEICGDFTDATVTFRNRGATDVTSLEITYDIDGGTPMTQNWTGNLGFYESTTIELANISTANMVNGTINASITAVNGNTDGEASDNLGSVEFAQTTSAASGENYTLTVVQDRYGSEITWQIVDASETVVAQGGPYANLQAAGTEEHVENVTLSSEGCYTVVMNDSYGDGFNGTFGAGSYVLKDAQGTEVISSDATFGKVEYKPFRLNSLFVGVEENSNNFTLFPNPTSQTFTIQTLVDGNSTVEIVNTLGQAVKTIADVNLSEELSIDVSTFKAGIYFVNVSTENGTSTQRLVVE